MGTEIERKFLVDVEQLKKVHPKLPEPGYIDQGYLQDPGRTDLIVRIRTEGDKAAWITIKGKGLMERPEFEYDIPQTDAVQLLEMCRNRIEKNRYKLVYGDDTWVLDEFTREHLGLWLAEIELKHVMQRFDRPTWLGKEVTQDARYTNVYLAEHSDRFWDES